MYRIVYTKLAFVNWL